MFTRAKVLKVLSIFKFVGLELVRNGGDISWGVIDLAGSNKQIVDN